MLIDTNCFCLIWHRSLKSKILGLSVSFHALLNDPFLLEKEIEMDGSTNHDLKQTKKKACHFNERGS